MPTKVVSQGIRLSFLIVTLAFTLVFNAKLRAEPSPPPPMLFGDVTVGRKFTPDPLVVRGMSGGTMSGKQIAGRSETPTGPCTGFFDEKPDHILELTSKFDYLKIIVDSPEDTTLIIKGPGGTWCNDDFEGKNPGMIGEWLSGTYNIWIGSYKKDQYFPYTLEVTEIK